MTVVTLYAPPTTPEVHEPPGRLARVPEMAVQLAWVRSQIAQRGLRTTDGEPVEVLAPGALNLDSGPDIRGAQLRIGSLLWSGDVEVHRTSADWARHGHDGDPAYDRVVLHVVLAADGATGATVRADGSRVPELVLLPHLAAPLARLVRDAHETTPGPPCAVGPLPAPPPGWLAGLGRRRLAGRARALGDAYRARPDVEALMARRVFRALGYEANADVMERLAERLDLGALRALPTDDARRSALMRQAGLANGLFDGGPALPAVAWRRGGRPANAPRVRLTQAARLLAPGGLLGRDGVHHALTLGDAVGLVDWIRGPEGVGHRLGAGRARDVVVNAVLPVLLLLGEQRGEPGVADTVFRIAEALAAPADRHVRAYGRAGVRAADALAALGVHELRETLCAEGRCARCPVGLALAPGLARPRS